MSAPPPDPPDPAPHDTAPFLPPPAPADDTTPQSGPPTALDLVGPPRIAGYVIEGELGRGGMGVVYQARDTALNRTVGLKMLLSAAPSAPAELRRFEIEAEVVAAIDHPHVVRVYGSGFHLDRPYFAMEYLPGGTLAGRIEAAGPLSPADAVRVVEKIARGVQAAHERGVVHRDLKPQNILFDAAGEPKVTDFGLARRGNSELTHSNAVMGTPAYMAPEQAEGRARFVGPAADVYALGAILFKCLTGEPPFSGTDSWSVLRQVVHDTPPDVSSVAAGVPRDLALICRKCLAKAPRERYQTAAALADELQRFRTGEPVHVRPAGRAETALKWVRRKPAAAAVAGLLAVAAAATAAAVYFAVATYRAERARADGERAQKAAHALQLAVHEAMLGQLAAARSHIAEAEWLGADPAAVRRLKGEVALYLGDFPEAVRELRAAAAERPDGVVEQSLLATAYYLAMDEAHYEDVLTKKLSHMTARTAEENLYLGQALAKWDPDAGLPLLRAAVGQRGDALAQLALGEALILDSSVKGKPAVAEEALDALRTARTALRDNPVVIGAGLKGRLCAAVLHESTKNADAAAEHLRKARGDADVLARHADSPVAAAARAMYLRFAQPEADHAAALDEAAPLRTNLRVAYEHAMHAYYGGKRGRCAEAVQWLSPDGGPAAGDRAELVRMMLLLELGPDGRREALAAHREYARRVGPTMRLFAAAVPLAAGEPEAARAECAAMKGQPFALPETGLYEAVRAHLAGEGVGEDEVVSRAAKAGDRIMTAEAHYLLGLGQLARGDPAAAKRHFEDVAGPYRWPDNLVIDLSTAWLLRIKADPSWTGPRAGK